MGLKNDIIEALAEIPKFLVEDVVDEYNYWKEERAEKAQWKEWDKELAETGVPNPEHVEAVYNMKLTHIADQFEGRLSPESMKDLAVESTKQIFEKRAGVRPEIKGEEKIKEDYAKENRFSSALNVTAPTLADFDTEKRKKDKGLNGFSRF